MLKKKIMSLVLGAITGLSILGVSTVASADTSYTVKSGDTLWGISQNYNTPLTDLLSENGLSETSVIYPGDTIKVSNSGYVAHNQNTASYKEVAKAPVSTPATTSKQAISTTDNSYQASTPSYTSDNSSAKAWIANKESGGSYSAQNGNYVGKYQLSASYLNGDYSAANQERVADKYVAQRYGSWNQAKAHWEANGWY